MWAEVGDISVKFLIQDRDRKFSGEKFIGFWTGTARRIKTPVRSPMANSFMESWVGSIKRECLNCIVGLSREQINYCVDLWVSHYNTRRPHRGKGIDNNVLDVNFYPRRKGEIQCEQRLGGLITEWSRKEAA
jgi:putative transposase